LERQDHWVLLGKRVPLVSVEILVALGDREREDQLDLQEAQETKGIQEKTGPWALTVPQAQQGRQGREALWVCPARGGSVGCRDFPDQRAHQENRDQQEHLGTKAPPVPSDRQAQTDLVEMLVLMGRLGLMVHQAKMVFWDKGGTEEM